MNGARPGDEDALDEALDALDGRGPEYGGGLSNHGPMAAEALASMGRGDAVGAWVAGYARRLDGLPAHGARVDPAAWRDALGDRTRVGAWGDFFAEQVTDVGWREAVTRWASALVPGLAAAATHGLIRTAHAVRALDRRDTAPRRRELASALGYWAAAYADLGPDPKPAGTRDLHDAITCLPRVHGEGWLIAEVASAVRDDDDFHAAVDELRPVGRSPVRLETLATEFVRRYVEQRENAPIAYVHTVTAPLALLDLLPHLPEGCHDDAFARAWQACAAIHSTHERVAAPLLEPVHVDAPRLIEQAVDCGDEHAIKFTLACLRLDETTQDPVFATAAADASRRLCPDP